jgi:hypothetical protein
MLQEAFRVQVRRGHSLFEFNPDMFLKLCSAEGAAWLA